ncbi:MAG: hypothetical protein Ct9H300mP16_09040 [Pseudomonadota bacterium]|nr:MAG: hypothetical protein Ct9H300mP16_09040 [Pseudomonadota bacterium]
MGEMAIRSASAHSVVFYLKTGASVEEAGIRAMQDLTDLGGPYVSGMNIVALGQQGRDRAALPARRVVPIFYQTGDMSQHVEEERTFVKGQ